MCLAKIRQPSISDTYTFVRKLGSGSQGVVNLMQHRVTKQFYAVKTVKGDQAR